MTTPTDDDRRHRNPSGKRAPLPRRTRWAIAGGVTLLVATIASAASIAYNDPPFGAVYEWPPASEVSEPVARGGPLGPVPGPLSMPSIGASGAYDPDALTTTPAPTSRCSRCGERPTPAATTAAPSSTTDQPPAAEPTTEPERTLEVQPDTLGLQELVNRDRAAKGCGPVAFHPDLMTQSQAHAERQAAADSMHHSDGVTGFDSWSENVAYGYATAAEVHDAWMNSPDHRVNVLNCGFTLIGWGAADGPSGLRYWTEQFAA